MSAPSHSPMFGFDIDTYVDMSLGVEESVASASARYDLLIEQLDRRRDRRRQSIK
jgi:hypothetical protein